MAVPPARLLENICQRLQRDDPELTVVSTFGLDDVDFGFHLGRSLLRNTHLRRLQLFTKDLSVASATALAAGINQSRLQTISILTSGSLQPERWETSEAVLQIMFDCIIQSQTIDDIVVSEIPNTMLEHLRRVISSRQFLQGFAFFNYHRNGADLSLVLDLLRMRLTTLAHLRLYNVDLRTTGHNALAPFLRDNVILQTLGLERCMIRDDVVSSLVANWHPQSPLQHWKLSHNQLGHNCIPRLLQAIADHPALRSLDLSGNLSIGHTGLKWIGERLPNLSHLMAINIAQCTRPIWARPKKRRRKYLMEATQALLGGMKQNLSIKCFRVVASRGARRILPQNVEDLLTFYAQLNKMGRCLLPMAHDVAPTIWCHVLSKCRTERNLQPSLVFSILLELPTLVQQRQNHD